jgi:hypothetical protein
MNNQQITAFVTGANRGLGKRFAAPLVERGAKVLRRRACRVSKFVASADALISTFPLVSSTWRTVLSHFRGESWNHTCVQCLGGRVVTCWPSGRVPGVWPSAGGLSRDRRPGAAW